MDLNNLKRDYKFKSEEAYRDKRRNRNLIIICMVCVVILFFLFDRIF